jgi:ADP-heptose:LPS heptosyltransferase
MKPICLDLGECNGLGDLICATPTIKKLSEAYNQKIVVISKMPELFKLNPYVEKSYKVSSIDKDYIKANYIMHNSFYNVGKKNEHGVEYKHNMIDIRQFHAIHLGFMLDEHEMECFYKPTHPFTLEVPEKYVLIHPVQTWATRTWEAKNWMMLTKLLNNLGIAVISIGKDSSETGFFNVNKPVFNFDIELGKNLMNKTNISDCWHLINKSQAFITMDSGLLHLAGTTDTPIVHLGSHLKPEFRMPYRFRNSQSRCFVHNGKLVYYYVRGGCGLECGSDAKYGIKEWGNIQGVAPLIECLENKPTFECHPSVLQVFEVIQKIMEI